MPSQTRLEARHHSKLTVALRQECLHAGDGVMHLGLISRPGRCTATPFERSAPVSLELQISRPPELPLHQ
jgi:hypothetical protein